jgi:hypothetical protein
MERPDCPECKAKNADLSKPYAHSNPYGGMCPYSTALTAEQKLARLTKRLEEIEAKQGPLISTAKTEMEAYARVSIQRVAQELLKELQS